MATERWRKENADRIRAARKKWYEANRTKQKQLVIDRRHELLEWLRDYKSSLACERCGENHPACLDFHHNNPSEKDMEIARAIAQWGWSKERVLAEIAKCSVLCSNCHRKLHWKAAPMV